MIFVRYQGFNAAAAVVENALRRLILPRGALAQTAGFHDGPGQVGNALLRVRQLVGDKPQFLPNEKLFPIGAVNAIEAAQIIIVRVSGEFEELRDLAVQLDSFRKRFLLIGHFYLLSQPKKICPLSAALFFHPSRRPRFWAVF